MPFLNVEIVAFVDEYQPGIVRCAFTDVDGNRHLFLKKIPHVTTQALWRDSSYPQKGTVECENVERVKDAGGRRLARVTIDVSDSMDSPGHSASFIVLESQLSDSCWAI